MTWEVRVELREGGEATLQVGFPTRDAALDYRVRLALWKRVWVQETAPDPAPAVRHRLAYERWRT